ncbi:hypothetical protein HDU96_001017 [Phlyctochytrium bullatum]|nr:hypothetical protein HDU96_001017 [Phlyctochytrium bullatum]
MDFAHHHHRHGAHPFVLANARTSKQPTTSLYSTSPAASSFSSSVMMMRHEEETAVEVDLFIHSDKTIDGLFIRTADAEALGLEVVAEEEDTCYGHVRRFSPVTLSALSHILEVTDVYELPAAFAGHAKYQEGIVGITLLWALGVTVAIDRGTVYLTSPDVILPSPAPSTSFSSSFLVDLKARKSPIAFSHQPPPSNPPSNAASSRSGSPVPGMTFELDEERVVAAH